MARNMRKENKKEKKEKKKFGILSLLKLLVLVIVIAILLVVGLMVAPLFIDNSKQAEENFGVSQTHAEDVNQNLEQDLHENEIKQIKNILLLGSDTRNTNDIGAGRSDTMIVFSINPIKNSIKLISIPRDSYVNIPGRGMDKLNHAYAYGGEQLLIKTINQNFKLNITDYVTIDFKSLAKVIEEIGGIEMQIDEAERRYINGGSGEIYRLIKKKYRQVPASGLVTLDGAQAVTYARDRTNGNDFTRQQRQRNVINAAMSKITKLSPSEALNLANVLIKEVKTNVNVLSYSSLLTDVIKERDAYMQNVYQAQIPDASFGKGTKINGIYYFTYSDAEAQKRFAEYIYEK